MNSKQALCLTMLSLPMASCLLQAFSFAPLISFITKDLSLSYTQFGLFQSIFYLAYVLMQVVAGITIDRHPSRKIIGSAFALFSISSVYFAFSQTYLEAVTARVVMGASMAFIFVPVVRFILEMTEPRDRATAMGLLGGVQAVGTIAATGVPIPLTTVLGSWRLTMGLMDVLSVTTIALLFLLPPEVFRIRAHGQSGPPLSGVLKRSVTWTLGYVNFIRLGIYVMFYTWIPAYLMSNHGFSGLETGLALGSASVLSLITTPLGGYLSDRLRRQFLVIEFTFFGEIVAILALALLPEYSVLWASTLTLGSLILFNFSSVFAILPGIYRNERLGFVTGIQNTFANAAGIVLPTVMGVIKDTTGSFIPGWSLLTLMAVAGAALALTVRRF